MKKIFYGFSALGIILLIFYAFSDKIADSFLPKGDADVPKDSLPYYENQFIFTFPAQYPKVKYIADSTYFTRLGLKLISRCSCLEGYELWDTGGKVRMAPDTDPPVMDTMKTARINKILPSLLQKGNLPALPAYKFAHNFKLYFPVQREQVRYPRRPFPTSIPRLLTPVKVAIIDTGVDTNNTDLKPFLYRNSDNALVCQGAFKQGYYGLNTLNKTHDPLQLEPYDNDKKSNCLFSIFGRCIVSSVRQGHGTMINGIIEGLSDYPNQLALSTEASNVRIELINVKFVNESIQETRYAAQGSLFDALCGVHYALDKDAQVINASWSILPTPEEARSVRETFYTTLKAVKEKNAILVTSAGNDLIKNDPTKKIWPAMLSADPTFDFRDNVIAVGAWDTNEGQTTLRTNEGDFVDVYAPGKNIILRQGYSSGAIFNRQQPMNGSSFATAFVTRQVALLKGQNPAMTPLEIKNRIRGMSEGNGTSLRVFRPTQ